jgi:hypothetical protein
MDENNQLNQQWLEFAYWTAGANWMMWKADFEYGDDISNMPVLRSAERFSAFVSKYHLRLFRTHESVRLALFSNDAEDFVKAITNASGQGIDLLAINLNATYPGLRTQKSLISKLAAFAKPERFIAWDRFARKGAAALAKNPNKGSYQTYEAYLADVNKLLEGKIGIEIREFLSKRRLPSPDCLFEAFARRVFDVYLMVQGGRWQAQLAGHPAE